MQSPSSDDTTHDLPTVVPPSGKFIVKLFLVPGLIVAGAVLVILACSFLASGIFGFGWLAAGSRSPDSFLKQLDSSNADQRWRGANDLAQVLLRDDQLASDPRFALDVADRMDQAVEANAAAEKDLAQRFERLNDDERKRELEFMRPGRNYVLYLSACLGDFAIPAGASSLNDMALNKEGLPKSKFAAQYIAQRRWQALWALANLGENLKRFDRLPEDRRSAILAGLKTEADAAPGSKRAERALQMADYLGKRQDGKPTALGVDQTMAQCATDANPFLREVTAFALNFWAGAPRENEAMELTLVELTKDNGHGEELLDGFYQDPEDYGFFGTHAPAPRTLRAYTARAGSKIRYNAAVALARRGSDHVNLDLLREMLDEPSQLQNFRLKYKDGSDKPDEGTVYQTVNTALKAVAELHAKKPALDLSSLHPPLEELSRSNNTELQKEAAQTREALAK